MAEVHAVKNKDTILLISHLLEMRHSKQMSLVWQLGINLGLRISDLLSIKFTDIKEDRLQLVESKTAKQASILLNTKALTLIQQLQTQYPSHEYIFQSYRSRLTRNKPPRPLSRRAVGLAFESIGQEIKIALGTHSMRKTRGYHLYQETKDIGRVMKMLRHSSEVHTLKYIGITQEDIDTDFKQLVL
ncbi:MAG: tyrosine-type recombinase/integrase [Paraglaciecola sp.]